MADGSAEYRAEQVRGIALVTVEVYARLVCDAGRRRYAVWLHGGNMILLALR